MRSSSNVEQRHARGRSVGRPHSSGGRRPPRKPRRRSGTVFASKSPTPASTASGDAKAKLIRKLQTQRTELGKRKEELRLAQRELKTLRARVSAFYHHAPVGYLMLDDMGFVLDANLQAARMCGVEHHQLVCHGFYRFLAAESKPDFYRHLREVFAVNSGRLKGDPRHTCELRLRRPSGRTFAARLESVLTTDEGPGRRYCWTVFSDIDDRKRAEEALARSRAELAAMFEAMTDAAVFADAERRILMVNPAFTRMFGYSADEVSGRTTEFLYTSPRAFRDEGRLHYQSRGPVKMGVYEIQYRRRDGTVFWAESSGSPVHDQQGVRIGFVSVHRDITNRKKAEAALRESESRYRELVQNASSAIIRWARDGAITFINEYAQSLFGYRTAEVVGRNVSILVPRFESTGSDLRRLVQEIVDHPETHTQNINENVGRDGRRIWMAWTNRPLFDEQGRLTEILAVGLNITVQKRAEEALRQLTASLEQRVSERTEELSRVNQLLLASEQALADFFAEAPLGLLWVAPDGRILRANRVQAAMFGYGAEKLLGRRVAEFGAEPELLQVIILRLGQKELVHDNLVRLRRSDGSLLHVLIDANGLWQSGKLVRSRWFVRDVTRQVELQKEILAIGERVQQQIGRDLHDDLGQQLASIQFLSQALEQELQPRSATQASRAKEIARLARQAVTHARELSHGLSPMTLESEGAAEVFRSLATRTARLFQIDCRFQGDAAGLAEDGTAQIHLYRIAQEAINNAIRHGKARLVQIGLQSKGDKTILSVHDDGRGLPARGRARDGLGLRIMQYRASALGGSLTVQNRQGGGASVVCSIPSAPANPPKRDQP